MVELSREDQYLLKEYENAAQVTFHIDELRNSLTGFFVAFSGLAAAALAFLLKEQPSFNLGIGLPTVVSILLALLGVLGLIVVLILARCRRVQLEHFRIINNIRTHFLGTDVTLWNVVQLSANTVPAPTRTSGTYYWASMIMLATALMLSGAAYLALAKVFVWMCPQCSLVVSAGFFLVVWVLEDRLYMSRAKAPQAVTYTATDVAKLKS